MPSLGSLNAWRATPHSEWSANLTLPDYGGFARHTARTRSASCACTLDPANTGERKGTNIVKRLRLTLFQSKDEPGGESEEWRRKVPFWVGFGFEKF